MPMPQFKNSTYCNFTSMLKMILLNGNDGDNVDAMSFVNLVWCVAQSTLPRWEYHLHHHHHLLHHHLHHLHHHHQPCLMRGPEYTAEMGVCHRQPNHWHHICDQEKNHLQIISSRNRKNQSQLYGYGLRTSLKHYLEKHHLNLKLAKLRYMRKNIGKLWGKNSKGPFDGGEIWGILGARLKVPLTE